MMRSIIPITSLFALITACSTGAPSTGPAAQSSGPQVGFFDIATLHRSANEGAPLEDEPAVLAFQAMRARFAAGTHRELQLPIFRLAPLESADERVAAAARTLQQPGLLDPAWSTIESPLTSKDGSYVSTTAGNVEYRVNKLAGTERLINKALFHEQHGALDALPLEQYAGKAEEYLRAHASAGVVPSLYLYKTRRYVQTGAQPGTLELSQVSVAFNQSVAGLPVIGSGGKFVVHVAPDLTIAGHETTVRPVGDVVATAAGTTLRSPDEAQAAVEARLIERGVRLADFELVRAELGYLRRGRNSVQTYLAPYYGFFWQPRPGVMGKKLVETIPAVTGAEGLALVEADEQAELARKAERLATLPPVDVK